jgi:hypothetical protein
MWATMKATSTPKPPPPHAPAGSVDLDWLAFGSARAPPATSQRGRDRAADPAEPRSLSAGDLASHPQPHGGAGGGDASMQQRSRSTGDVRHAPHFGTFEQLDSASATDAGCLFHAAGDDRTARSRHGAERRCSRRFLTSRGCRRLGGSKSSSTSGGGGAARSGGHG